MDEHKDLPVQIISLDPAAPNISLGSLEADLKSCGVNDNFMLINDISLVVKPTVELSHRERATRMNSKLSFSHQGRLYG